MLLVFHATALFSQEMTDKRDATYGLDPLLYNGRQYNYFPPPGSMGHPFFFDPGFSPGSVTIKGKTFHNLLLNYDTFNQELLLRYTTATGAMNIIAVSRAWLQGFSLGDANFTCTGPGEGSRIMQVLGDGDTRILYYHRKTLKLDVSVNPPSQRYTPERRAMYLEQGRALTAFSNNRALISLLPADIQPVLKGYLRRHKINTRNAADSVMHGLAVFIGEYAAPGPTTPELKSTVSAPAVRPGVEIPDRLPDWRSGTETGTEVRDEEVMKTRSEERYLTGRRADVPQVMQVGRKELSRPGSEARVRVRVIEMQTGEPVIGATMFVEETKNGAATDMNGFLSMILRTGTYTAIFASMGLETKKYSLEVFSDGEFLVELNKTVIQMKEVEVFGDRQMSLRLKDPGLEKISAKAIKEIPMMLGERDIIKVSEMMPGIVTVGEGSAGLNVRGGNYDQNAFFINKIPVYNTSHLYGFFPAFNADIIKDFSIHKGYIPAQYGGRISSVFNILARQGNRKRFTARGSISPVAAGLTVEGPVKKDTSSFLLSGRFLYSDWILRQIDDPVIRESQAGFRDVTASWNYDFSKSQLSVFAYHSHDKVRLSDLTAYEYANNGASVNLSKLFGASLRGQFCFAGMQYAFSTTDRQDVTRGYRHDYSLGDFRFTADLSQDLRPGNTLDYGGGITYFRLDRGLVEPFGEGSLRIPVGLGEEQGLESAIYLADTWDALPWMTISAGVRLGLFTPLGPRTVYTYYPDGPKDPRYVNDTLSYGPGQAIKWYVQPDFRLAVNIRTDDAGTVKIAFNRLHQNLFLLNNTIALAPNAQWKLADYHLGPSRSLQATAGVFRSFGKSGWEASLEAYCKFSENIPEFIDGADFLAGPNTETVVLPGKQSAYGLEFLLRRSGRKLEGWLAYTLSRSMMKVDGGQAWTRINDGKTYPANYDIPHVINAVVNYHFNRRVTFSTVMAYQTGRPVTYPTSVYYIGGMQFVDYSERNAYRIPDYFRLDASLTIEGNLKRNKPLHNSIVVGVYNLTGRENPYSVYFTMESGKIKSYRYSVIGVPVVTVTWLFKLGNYASD